MWLDGEAEGRQGGRGDGFMAFGRSRPQHTPGIERLLSGNWNKFLPIVSWALVSESNAVFINWTDFKKQNTKKQKGVENFMLNKKTNIKEPQ